MPRYEAVLILDLNLSEADVQALVAAVSGQITAGGGHVAEVRPWGKKALRYPIRRASEGNYYLILFEAPGRAIEPLRASWNLNEKILRAVITRQAVVEVSVGSQPQ